MVNTIGFRYDEIMPNNPFNFRLFLHSNPGLSYPIAIDDPKVILDIIDIINEENHKLEQFELIKQICNSWRI